MRAFYTSGFSDALDWRCLPFQESVIVQSACALCGVVTPKAVKLPCAHRLCSQCHRESEKQGATCPFDGSPFCEEELARIDISDRFLQKRTVACWNAPNGCDFVGPTSRLLEHIKECTFHVVHCPRCESSVLRTEIVGHYKDGCSVCPATSTPVASPVTLDHGYIKKTGDELKEEILKISEGVSSMQTSFNKCLEDIRATDRRTKEQLETQSSTLSEQIIRILSMSHELLATQLDESKLSNVPVTVADAVKAHLTQELRAQSKEQAKATESIFDLVLRHSGPRKFYWCLKGWEALKRNAPGKEFAEAVGPFIYAFGYKVHQRIRVFEVEEKVNVGVYLFISVGAFDSKLEWPFRKSHTHGVLHTTDKEKKITHLMDVCKRDDIPAFNRPTGKGGRGYGIISLCTADRLEHEGFVHDDSLHIFLEVHPFEPNSD